MIGLAGRVGEGGFDVVGFEVRKVTQDVFVRRTVREAPEDISDPNTHTPDTRTTAALVRLHRDALEELHRVIVPARAGEINAPFLVASAKRNPAGAQRRRRGVSSVAAVAATLETPSR